MKALIAIDGSQTSRAALEEALVTLPLVRMDVAVICVADRPERGVDEVTGGEVGREFEQAAWQEVRQALERLRRARVPATGLVRAGEPADEILAAARELQADLVVVGSHGRSRFGRFMLGSVSDAVVHRFPGMTLVVGPGRQRATRVEILKPGAVPAEPG
jgi:nucleotide-binding universal stress UspA family protein